MRRFLATLAFLVIGPILLAQQSLNNEGILKLIKAGLSEDLIIATINASPGTYDISADGLVALKTAGASDKVIAAVVHKAGAAATAPPAENQNSDGAPVTGSVSSAGASSDIPETGTASGSKPVTPGARIVIAPMGGFETYFAAAVREKKVPIRLTLDKASAQYFVVSTNTEWEGFVYGAGGGSHSGSSGWGAHASSTRGLEASIMLIEAKTKDVVWAYEVHKNSHGALIFGTFGARGQQSIAEACAKHLKEYIEKGK